MEIVFIGLYAVLVFKVYVTFFGTISSEQGSQYKFVLLSLYCFFLGFIPVDSIEI